MSVTAKKRTTLEDIRNRMDARAKRDEEISAAIKEAQEKMNSLAKDKEAALRAGNRNEFEKIKQALQEAELDFDFASNQQNEVPPISQKEKEEARDAFMKDFKTKQASAEKRLLAAVENLKTAVTDMTYLQNSALKEAEFLAELSGLRPVEIISALELRELRPEAVFLQNVDAITGAEANVIVRVNDNGEYISDISSEIEAGERLNRLNFRNVVAVE